VTLRASAGVPSLRAGCECFPVPCSSCHVKQARLCASSSVPSASLTLFVPLPSPFLFYISLQCFLPFHAALARTRLLSVLFSSISRVSGTLRAVRHLPAGGLEQDIVRTCVPAGVRRREDSPVQ